MLEILLLLALTRNIGAMVENKGYKAGRYKALAVILWFGGEILGFAVGAGVLDDDSTAGAYLFALMGAALGAFTAYQIARSLKPLEAAVDHEVFD